LNNEGWQIKYPKGREKYEILKRKKVIIVGFLGNRNKGKSFLLSKLTYSDIPLNFSINREGISVCFGEKDDNCLAMLNSFGQEFPLLFKNKFLKNKDDIKEINIMKSKNKNNIIEEVELNENNLKNIILRDKIITKKFIKKFNH
jgi:hypothetical protein